MSALGAVQSALVGVQGIEVKAPVTNSTGGTSVGDPLAGISKVPSEMGGDMEPATVREKVAAGFLTFAVVGGVVGGSLFMVLESS